MLGEIQEEVSGVQSRIRETADLADRISPMEAACFDRVDTIMLKRVREMRDAMKPSTDSLPPADSGPVNIAPITTGLEAVRLDEAAISAPKLGSSGK
jgi:hypothetical protein